MSVDAAQAKLNHGLKGLRGQWALVRSLWRDPVAEQFEREFIADLEADLRITLAAMDQLRTALSQARNDCG
jgi:hypothetical protein